MVTESSAIEEYQEIEKRLKERNIGSKEFLKMVSAYGNALADAYYRKGLNDAWELANTICGFTQEERYETFGNYTMEGVFANRTPQEALAKLKAYEDRIEVGDVVTYAGDKGVVLDKRGNKIIVLSDDCWVSEWYECDVEKTGKHIALGGLLEQIGE